MMYIYNSRYGCLRATTLLPEAPGSMPVGATFFPGYRQNTALWRLGDFRLSPKRYRAWIAGILTPSLGGPAIWSRPLEIFTLRLPSAVKVSRSRFMVVLEERACRFSGLALAEGSRGWLAGAEWSKRARAYRESQQLDHTGARPIL